MNFSNIIENFKQELKKTVEYQLWLYKKINESILKEEWELVYNLYLGHIDYILKTF